MVTTLWRRLLGARASDYRRRPPLVLVNGLAEQAETWYANLEAWRRRFEVHLPALSVYDGPVIQRRIARDEPLDVEFFIGRLHTYIAEFVQEPVYLLANSMGGKIVVEFAVRYPELVRKLVLLCPSGLAVEERLPLVEGVRRSDLRGMVESVFHDAGYAAPEVLAHYERRFRDRRWRSGLLRTVRGTMEHRVRGKIAEVAQPTLLIVGREDRIVDPRQSIEAGGRLPRGRIVALDRCGHAPQIEQAEIVNRLVVEFLTSDESPIGSAGVVE
jgi:pimeloyl-ACP methyl ester carboxylesterase